MHSVRSCIIFHWSLPCSNSSSPIILALLGNMTVTRSIISDYTSVLQRSVAMARLSIAMTIGFASGSGTFFSFIFILLHVLCFDDLVLLTRIRF